MAFRIKGSHITALLIAGAVIGWMATGDIVVGGQANSANAVAPPAERRDDDAKVFKVRFVTVSPEIRPDILTVRGRTIAESVVAVRAKTSGTLEKRLVSKGDAVKMGDLVCQLDRGVRQTIVARATAALEQAAFEHDGAIELQKQGYTSDGRVKSLKAVMDSASASLAEAKQELSYSDIVATADGIVQDPIAEIGDNLSEGGTCITLINSDPMLFTGQVSERQVGSIAVGDTAKIQLISGEVVEGDIRYIATSADAATRTFLIEIELPNGDHKLRDGVTAVAQIALEGAEAYKVKSSWLTLNDNGDIGVRIVDDNNLVMFKTLKIISHTPQTMWVTGLEPGSRVITVGQDYVIAGQTVEPVPADADINQMKDESNS
ncbi:MAG: efflux RND transporter periplasmic adaptor subunit [Rhizobiaceae bacterium]|nr:efflux RND transporter periplasmic adaptor subunit [Rhizobiaceae bacterium]